MTCGVATLGTRVPRFGFNWIGPLSCSAPKNKRTFFHTTICVLDISAVAVYSNNQGLAQANPGQAGLLGGVTASASTDSNAYSLGIRHRF